ncbi:serine hydrolase domain-containing protein [Lentzea sp. NPDC058450]|uniref:serine hydrolase domain-containing protein n=1 Tax=Lentzea sp. NPDC058450 TaxID=3346505 RepID=UPI00364C8088
MISWGAALTLLVTTYMGEASIPGMAVAVTKDDQIVSVQGYGHDSTGAPITGRSKMAIASVSKSFTALAVRQLADEGRLDLDRPVFDSRVAPRQLLAHKSGISDRTLKEKSLPQPNSPAEAVERAKEVLQNAVPDDQFRYTNTNYHLLARVVEEASGENFNAYLKKHVFDPLGMRDTTAIDVTPRDLPPDYPKGFGYAYGVDVPLTEPDRFVTGSDGVITTGDDMAKWLAAQPRLQPRDGMGWEADDQGRLRHNGIWFTGTAGQLLTQDGHGIAVLSNSGLTLGNDGTYLLENAIADVVAGRTPPEPESYRLLVDLVLAALVLLSIGLNVRALRRPRRFHKAWQVLRFVPVVVLLTLPALIGVLYGGRDITFFQLMHYSLPLVVWLGVSSVMNLSVAVVRWRR